MLLKSGLYVMGKRVLCEIDVMNYGLCVKKISSVQRRYSHDDTGPLS
jgi:hypothetical protein